MLPARTYLWQQAPAIRLLAPLVAGLLLQWYLPLSPTTLAFLSVLGCLLAGAYIFLPLPHRFRFKSVQGGVITLLLVTAGAWLVWLQDIRHHPAWFARHYGPQDVVRVVVEEPPVEKARSFKAVARVTGLYRNDSFLPVQGKMILYFKKGAGLPAYGACLLVARQANPVKNTGNPGGFDYERYSLFQGITHQVYLAEKDFTLLPDNEGSAFRAFLWRSRSWVVATLQRYIGGAKEQGLAEALLIGYKDDLDKNLLQAYANTGVVHVIAISGLHLGLIYGLLLLLTQPLGKRKLYWIRTLTIIAGLWLFSFLCGAQPSILRSAVMFTALALSHLFGRRTSILNTLALSAFLLLCLQPFWLWDVGFQLSYTAVLSIILFYQPIYNWLYFGNKAVDFVWKLAAATLSAQVLTTPVSLYHFHQFPLLFLFTNLLAVPLSSIILIGALLLCGLSFYPPAARVLGPLLEYLIRQMNTAIESLDTVTFAVWDGISLTVPQAVLLLAAAGSLGYWLLEKWRPAALVAATAVLLFTGLRSFSFLQATGQKKLVVYHVPRHQAIDLIDGRSYRFIGDPALERDKALASFYLRPARIQHRVQPAGTLPVKAFRFYRKHILILDRTVAPTAAAPQPVDVLVLSRNPQLQIGALHRTFRMRQLVIDGSVPAWKARRWLQESRALGIPCHDVAQKGAFEMKL